MVWVVDNDSDDKGDGIESAFEGVHLIHSEKNLGFAGGNNLALGRAVDAACDVILLLNNDARFDETDLDTLIDTLMSDTTIGVIGPVLRDRHPPHRVLSMGGRDISRHFMTHEFDAPSNGFLKEVAYVPGTVVLIRASVFRNTGLLDERYFFGGEMADLCARARAVGLRSIIQSQARALHDVARSSRVRDSLHAYYVIRNRFLYIRKFHRQQRLWLYVYWAGGGMAMGLAALLRGNTRRARAISLGVWHGLIGRFGGRNSDIWPELNSVA